MNALIVDDEYAGRNSLLLLLNEHCKKYINRIDAVSNSEDALRSMKQRKYHLIFLDIHLQLSSGLDLVKFIPESTKIIFVTAYAEYAIAAIKNRAFDYLLKPVNASELWSSVERCYMQHHFSEKQFLTIKHNGLTVPLDFQQILLLRAKGPYAEIHDVEGKLFVTSQTLKVLEPKLNDDFIRVHKSYIVNRNFIKGFNQKELLLNEQVIPISRNGLLNLQTYFSV